MSASVVKSSPLRWRDVWSLDGHPRSNPLGTKTDFERRYVQSRTSFRVPTKYGGSFTIEKLNWNLGRLHEVRHRVADRVHSIRKTDPAIRDMFKGMTSMITPVQLSREDARLYDAVISRAEQANENDEGGLAQYALLLRHICNNPLALRRTEIEFGAELVERYPTLITSAHSAKVDMVVDQLESIRDAGDKCVLFTSWVYTSLDLIADELRRRDISLRGAPRPADAKCGPAGPGSVPERPRYHGFPVIGCRGLRAQPARGPLRDLPTSLPSAGTS